MNILDRLEGIKSAGGDKYLARCPAHPDKHPSLAIRLMPDGRVLLHCFAGCETSAVLEAVGMTFSDLMPEPLGDFQRVRPVFTPIEALQALARECGLVAIEAGRMANGHKPTDEDAQRVCIAAGRIAEALEYVHGN